MEQTMEADGAVWLDKLSFWMEIIWLYRADPIYDCGTDNPSQKEKRGIIIQKSKVKVRL